MRHAKCAIQAQQWVSLVRGHAIFHLASHTHVSNPKDKNASRQDFNVCRHFENPPGSQKIKIPIGGRAVVGLKSRNLFNLELLMNITRNNTVTISILVPPGCSVTFNNMTVANSLISPITAPRINASNCDFEFPNQCEGVDDFGLRCQNTDEYGELTDDGLCTSCDEIATPWDDDTQAGYDDIVENWASQ